MTPQETKLESDILAMQAGLDAVNAERDAAKIELGRLETLVRGLKACPLPKLHEYEPVMEENTARPPALAWEQIEANEAKQAFYAENREILRRYVANGS